MAQANPPFYNNNEALLPFADRLKQQKGQSQNVLTYKIRWFDQFVSGFLFLCGAISILTTVGFIIVLGTEALKFFATTEYLNVNKQLTLVITAQEEVLTVSSSGSALNVGDMMRIGVDEQSEVVEILEILDSETVRVTRGINGTSASEHPARSPLFVGAEVTLTKFFTETKWAPQIGAFGILPLLNATLRVALLGMLVSLPLGLGAAIYLSEYASPKTRSTLKPILEILAGIPTVVYGYFALTFVTPLLRGLFGNDTVEVFNVFSAGIVVGILIVPTISSICEDALSAVPKALREASYGLGATKLETILNVLLPAALSGISAAVILGISRAVGETMVVLIAAGAGPAWTFDNFKAAETMAGHIARISTGDISYGSIDYNSVFAIGLTLFIMTLALNLLSTLITRRFREVYS